MAALRRPSAPRPLDPPVADGVGGRLLTQQEAAALAGCSKDTVVRARRSGRLPHARLYQGRWMIPDDDLAAAGFSVDIQVVAESDDGGDLMSIELARAEARIAALEDLVTRQDDELRFLRQLTTATLSRKAS